MVKKDIRIVASYSEGPLSLDQVCEICNASHNDIQTLIEYEIIKPLGEAPNNWQFTLIELQRAKKALRLQHELEVNVQGIAILLDLLEEIKRMRERINTFEKIFFNDKNED